MAREEHISCDNPDCDGGSKHFKECGKGHDICSCCSQDIDESWNHEELVAGKSFCPICIKEAELK